MNEQIKEIIERTVKTTLLEFSTEYVTVSIESEELGVKTVQRIPIEFCERFAELIVKECMNRVSKWGTFIVEDNVVHHSNIADDINEDLRKHFGVE